MFGIMIKGVRIAQTLKQHARATAYERGIFGLPSCKILKVGISEVIPELCGNDSGRVEHIDLAFLLLLSKVPFSSSPVSF
ncbi:MAG: hypothetical protein P8N14_06585 [Sulfitobacter sp.]|nr:hypothetical protein [Sulfitobacter sp.]